MRTFIQNLKSSLLLGTALLATAGAAHAVTTVTFALTASKQATTLPDGLTIGMWGWQCSTTTLPTISTPALGTPTCNAANGQPQTTATIGTGLVSVWQPPVITVPYDPTGTSLSITLTNKLPVPTSLTIIGERVSAGDTSLGVPTRESAPRLHSPQVKATWPIQGANTFTPPTQSIHARSFGPEAAAGGGTFTYTWNSIGPNTGLKPGTYLIESGTYPSIQGPMGLYGVLVVTTPPVAGATPTAGVAYQVAVKGSTTPAQIQYDSDAVLLLSELDPVQNTRVFQAVATPGFDPTAKWTPVCALNHTCYPPAVDYTPTYFMVNGKPYDRTNPMGSAVNLAATVKTSGYDLLRIVNAGLRMHAPTSVGLPYSLVAEDGNVAPELQIALSNGKVATPKTTTDAFMPAGKVYDLWVQPQLDATGLNYAPNFYPTFDRGGLSLSNNSALGLANSSGRDAGMQTVVLVGGTYVPAVGTTPPTYTGVTLPAGMAVTPIARNVSFVLPLGTATYIGNVILNDVGISNASFAGVGGFTCAYNPGGQVLTAGLPAGWKIVLVGNGHFTVTSPTPFTAGQSASFPICGDGNPALAATISLSVAAKAGAPTAIAHTFTSPTATYMAVSAPGVLAGAVDPTGYQMAATRPGLQAPIAQTFGSGNATITLHGDGALEATATAPGTYTFNFVAQNVQGTQSAPEAVTLVFPAGNGPTVRVVDAGNATSTITDYKWIIEQDLTFQVFPGSQYNTGTGTPSTLATNFHASYMPVIAAGCTGPQSCERAQTIFEPATGNHVPAVCTPAGPCLAAAAGTFRPTSRPQDVALPTTDATGNPARYYISILPGDATNPFNTGFAGTPDPATCATTPGTTATGVALTSACGHTMGGTSIMPPVNPTTGAPIVAVGAYPPVTVTLQPSPLKPSDLTVFVFEDDNPLNGEHDVSGGNEGHGTAEPGLGEFEVELWDAAGGVGDATGQMTHDFFNEPLTNSLNGMIDPRTGQDACPIATAPLQSTSSTTTVPGIVAAPGTMQTTDSSGNTIVTVITTDPVANTTTTTVTTTSTLTVAVGRIVVCPTYEADGLTVSPLAGQAIVHNLMPGRYGVIVHPSAAREARGEEWLQTNTLDGTHFLDAFLRVGEPAVFQEFGPGGFHVFMGMANPAIINGRLQGACSAAQAAGAAVLPTPVSVSCTNSIQGHVTSLHQSRLPNETLYDTGVFPFSGVPGSPGQDPRNNQVFADTTCYASLGDPDSADIAFTKCDQDGNFNFANIPDGNWALKMFDQWLHLIVDGASKPVNVSGGNAYVVDYAAFAWHTHIWNNTYIDVNGNGIRDPGEPGISTIPAHVRMRNGKISMTVFSDLTGQANFNELFPLFNWYVVETDTVRFKSTGVHVVYDAGGAVDGPTGAGSPPPGGGGNGTNGAYAGLVSTVEHNSLPAGLRYPGSIYCAAGDAECKLSNLTTTPTTAPTAFSTGRIDPGSVVAEGVQGFITGTEILDWGKQPYAAGENGGIKGHVVYASTRPYDDPNLQTQNLWEPMVPNVTINLYSVGAAVDGSATLTFVDTTKTTSWDAWAQGWRTDPVTGAVVTVTDQTGFARQVPNMNCPGQDVNSPFYGYTLMDTPTFLGGLDPVLRTPIPMPYRSQFKCYDGLANFNQVQPAPYDGMYKLPSQAYMNAHPLCPTTITTPLAAQTAGCTLRSPGQTLVSYPPGLYVAEVVPPPGYELVKEEDKNILIGDNYIAPIQAQFPTLGNIYIVPDQASINAANLAYYKNPTGAQGPANPTTNMGRTSYGGFIAGGLQAQSAPCVGTRRIVPDFMSISPESGEVAAFAGATRSLCNRKRVKLDDQMTVGVDFFVWTKTPAASHYDGFILDDFSSEFDPASPTFGEKFAVPNLPVSIQDFNGHEMARTYSDQWGLYNGMTYSTWEVNPPNPTGYAPNMMITCMNDPGTHTTTSVVNGVTTTATVVDPWFNPAYSNFCYENPFMPADTAYLDTPVVPLSAYAEGYDPPDCAYPDLTPAIASVLGSEVLTANAAANALTPQPTNGRGPWVSRTRGPTLTITAMPDQPVLNPAYSGPGATTAPYNQKTILRHYGFGATAGQVLIGAVPAVINSWNDTQIVVTPQAVSGGASLAQLRVQQQGAPLAFVGELSVVTASGHRTVDTVTVTVGGKRPTYVGAESPDKSSVAASGAIQAAIDAAEPGDMIVVGPGSYHEMLLMWKPIRLQGVGAYASVINANAHPAGLLDGWRQRVVCMFGLSTQGYFVGVNGAQAPANCVDPTVTNPYMQGAVDPIPLEAFIGWDTNFNANIAELLLEPTLMGAYEGAAVTVLGSGTQPDIGDGTVLAGLLTGQTGCLGSGICTLLTKNDCTPFYGTTPRPAPSTATDKRAHNGYSNYYCNPSSVDGLTLTNSSQGGGGLFVHGWAHYLRIANNRITGNAGTLTGGMTLGQVETIDGTLGADNIEAPFLFNTNMSIHDNNISFNMAYGDELNSSTPGSSGGVTIAPGADNYAFSRNWVCGNLSTGDGGGMAHFGYSTGGQIVQNMFLFNQSKNPTIATWGGGVIIQGAPPDGAVCEASIPDVDCAPNLSNGTGNVLFDANLVLGNNAESGSGGGLRLQAVNGTDVSNNPTHSERWNHVTITNNIIANNVAALGGGGVSIQDAVWVDFVNNTVVNNDSTATAGVLFDTLGAPIANIPPPVCNITKNPGCTDTTPVTQASNQPAGLESNLHTPYFKAAFPVGTLCPLHHPGCTQYSNPVLLNNVFSQNRPFHLTTAGAGVPNSVATVQLVPQLNQTATGACVTGTGANAVTYWDIGVSGDAAPGRTNTTLYPLNPLYSVLGDSGYTTNLQVAGSAPSGNIITSTQQLNSQYCNGSRVPPEIASTLCSAVSTGSSTANAPGCTQPGAAGVSFTVPPGVPDALAPATGPIGTPINPFFNIAPAATVDEGNNWVNLFFGPLSVSNASIQKGAAGYGVPMGNYIPRAGSAVINAGLGDTLVTDNTAPIVPNHDFYFRPRPVAPSVTARIDMGAVQFAAASPPSVIVFSAVQTVVAGGGGGGGGGGGAGVTLTPTPWTPTALNGAGNPSVLKTFTLTNSSGTAVSGITSSITATPASQGAPFSINSTTCGGGLPATAGATCNVVVRFRPRTGTGSFNATLTVNDSAGTQTAALNGTAN